jgi:hypothetical protein
VNGGFFIEASLTLQVHFRERHSRSPRFSLTARKPGSGVGKGTAPAAGPPPGDAYGQTIC